MAIVLELPNRQLGLSSNTRLVVFAMVKLALVGLVCHRLVYGGASLTLDTFDYSKVTAAS